jgi:hypothetical protein
VVVALIGLFGVVYEYVVYGCHHFTDISVSGTPLSSGNPRDFVANYILINKFFFNFLKKIIL